MSDSDKDSLELDLTGFADQPLPNQKKIPKISSSLGHRERLRQRILVHGAASLADYELLEVLLFAASPRGDTKPAAKALLAEFGSFAAVVAAPKEQLRKIDGIGEAAIATLKMAQQFGERLLKSKIDRQNVLSSWQALLDYCYAVMGHRKVEHFRILFLNNKNILIADELQQTGTVNHTPVYPREVIKRALELGSTAIILVHNHPSGDTRPSQADIDMTKEVIRAAEALSIRVHDHLIIGANNHASFKSMGLI